MSRFDGIIEVAHDLAADLRRLADNPNPENHRNAAESLAAFRAAGEDAAAEILPYALNCAECGSSRESTRQAAEVLGISDPICCEVEARQCC